MTPTQHRCSVDTQPLHGGRREGMTLTVVDNGRLRIGLLPQRGMGIWKVWLDGLEFGWRSPVSGPVHPAFVPLHDADGRGWLEGFDELLCRCGLLSNGAPVFDAAGRLQFPLHGRIANLPAASVHVLHDAQSGALSITGVVDEARFLHHHLRLSSTLTVVPGATVFQVRDEVANLSSHPTPLQLLYHYNLGAPLLGPGARLFAPVRELAPRDARAAADVASWSHYLPPTPGYQEQVHYLDLHAGDDGRTGTLLQSADGKLAASLWFHRDQLPHYALWKHTAAGNDGYVTAMEPATNFPNARPFELQHGRAVMLEPGTSHRIELEFGFHQGDTEVLAARARIAAIHDGPPLRIHAAPRPDWSPAG